MLTNYCYQTDIRFQSLNCPVPSPLLCGLDIGYSGIKIQSPCNASIIPSIVVKARNDSPLLINGEDMISKRISMGTCGASAMNFSRNSMRPTII